MIRDSIAQFRRRIERRLGLFTPAIRGFTIRTNDTFIVSYPKSGNTWLRFQLAALLGGDDLSFVGIDKFVPDLYKTTRREVDRLRSPRFLKSHEACNFEYPRVVYLIRDPRDVAISYYYYLQKTGFFERNGISISLDEYLMRFPDEDMPQPHRNWRESVESWLARYEEKGEESVLLLRYEDMIADTVGVLSRIVEFCGLYCNEAQIRRAVERSSVKNMRESEKKVKVFKNNSIAFVRSAKSEQWKEVFTDGHKVKFLESYEDLMSRFNYR